MDARTVLDDALTRARRSAAPLVPRQARGDGLQIVQLAARGSVDADLRSAGLGDGGGVVTLLVQLARALARRPEVGEVVTVARGRGGEPLGPGARIERVPIGTPGQALRELWHEADALERELLRTLSELAPDVVHLRFADVATLAGARAARRLGIPFVFTLTPDPHALLETWEQRGLTHGDFLRFDRRERYTTRLALVDALVDEADALVTLPRAGGVAGLERLLGRSLADRPLWTVPEGIDADVARTARADVLAGRTGGAVDDLAAMLPAGRAGRPLLVSVGRLDPIKGMPRLAAAWAGDERLRHTYNLVVVGGDLARPDAGEREQLREIASHAHPGLVVLGHRPHDDVARLLAAAATGIPGVAAPDGLYACASAKEEFGVALLEALAAGLTVVAPDRGGPPSYIEHGHTGILVPPGSVEDLRAGLLAAEPLRRSQLRARAARDLIEREYSIDAMAAGLVSVYGAVVESRAAA